MGKTYCVYIHIRNDDLSIFYVGMGSPSRANDRFGRNPFWLRVAKKYGWTSVIVDSGLTRDEAYLLEMWLIAKFRHEGIRLTNLTEGGEGGQGIPSPLRKTVFCSNGMTFEHGYAAAEWLRGEGQGMARQGHIASCCRGERARAYGFAWSYDGIPIDDALPWKEAIGLGNSKAVNCENGMRFISCVEACAWVRSIGFETAISTRISTCANGETNSAYGFGWWYDGDDPKSYKPTTVAVECVGYGKFETLAEAAAWVSSRTKYKAQGRPIREAAEGNYKQAYGFKWRLI